MMEFRQLDDQSVDVKIVHSFRAHFDSVVGTVEEGDPSLVPTHTGSSAEKSEVTWVSQENNRKELIPVCAKKEELGRGGHEGDLEFAGNTVESSGHTKGLVSLQWSPWKIDPSKIAIGRRIAVGGFAEVFVGKYEVKTVLALLTTTYLLSLMIL